MTVESESLGTSLTSSEYTNIRLHANQGVATAESQLVLSFMYHSKTHAADDTDVSIILNCH